MLKLIRRRRREGEKGQALAEFALILPVFLILLFAIVDFGIGFYSYIEITHSAREGARLGAVHGSSTEIIDRVYNTANVPNESTNMTVQVINPQGSPGDSVEVLVDYDYEMMTPLAGLLQFATGGTISTTLTLSSTADMRLE